MSLSSNTSSLIWANYLDLQDDVKSWLQIQAANTTGDTRLQLMLDMACQFIQNFIGRPIAPTTFDRRFNGWSGWNGAYLELPAYPVLEIISVTEWWGVSGPHYLTEQTPANQVDGFQCEYLRGLLTRVFPGLVQRPWFPGSRNIEVVWVAGYNPIPADIKMATLELVAYWWRNTQQQSGARPGGPAAEYDPSATSGLWSGVPYRITDLLDPYVQVGLG
jgi:hypothetical protein